MDLINAVLNDEAVTAIILTCAILTLADFVLSVLAAIAKKTFALTLVAEFVRTHIVGRVLPIVTIAILGHFEAALQVIAATASVAYFAETIGSIRDSFTAQPGG